MIKITIENGKDKTVYKDVSDCFIAYRQLVPMADKNKSKIAMLPETRSLSINGGSMREIIKEVRQALDELKDIISNQK